MATLVGASSNVNLDMHNIHIRSKHLAISRGSKVSLLPSFSFVFYNKKEPLNWPNEVLKNFFSPGLFSKPSLNLALPVNLKSKASLPAFGMKENETVHGKEGGTGVLNWS